MQRTRKLQRCTAVSCVRACKWSMSRHSIQCSPSLRCSHRAPRCISSCAGVQLTYPAGVFVASCPMAGLSQVPDVLSTPLAAVLPSHVMVLLVQHGGECVVFDFLPVRPTSKLGALNLLRGGAVAGALHPLTSSCFDPG